MGVYVFRTRSRQMCGVILGLPFKVSKRGSQKTRHTQIASDLNFGKEPGRGLLSGT